MAHRKPRLEAAGSMCPPAEVAHLQLPSRDRPRRPLLSPARLLLAAAAGCWLAALLLLLRASNFSLATLADQITEPYAFCSASFDAVAASFVLVFTTPLLAPRFALPFSLAVAGFLTAKPVCAAATDIRVPTFAMAAALCAMAAGWCALLLSMLRVDRRARVLKTLDEALLPEAAEPSHASAPAPARPGVLSRLLFGWVWPLLRRGAAAQLEHDTLEPLWWASPLHAATHPSIITPMSSPRPKRPAVAPKCAAQVRGRPAPRGPVGPRLGGGEAVAAALRAPLRAALLGAGHSPSPSPPLCALNFDRHGSSWRSRRAGCSPTQR